MPAASADLRESEAPASSRAAAASAAASSWKSLSASAAAAAATAASAATTRGESGGSCGPRSSAPVRTRIRDAAYHERHYPLTDRSRARLNRPEISATYPSRASEVWKLGPGAGQKRRGTLCDERGGEKRMGRRTSCAAAATTTAAVAAAARACQQPARFRAPRKSIDRARTGRV